MTENKQQRPILIASFSAPFAAAHDFRARDMDGRNSCNRVPQTTSRETPKHETPRLPAQFLHRIIHAIHNSPVDITVDKEPPPNSEKAQQNRHFEYHQPVLRLHCDENKVLIAKVGPNSPASSPSAPIVTLVWNMHRFAAACSLNVTSVGICLSSQHYAFNAISHFSQPNPPPPLTPPKCGTIVKRSLECSRPTSQGFFRGLHESA
jgi:hypothetical protein